MNHYIIYGSFIHGGHLELEEDTTTGAVTLTDWTYDPRNWDLSSTDALSFEGGTQGLTNVSKVTKNTNLQQDSELQNVCAYRPTSEKLHIYDESSSDKFSNIVVEEYKLPGHLPLAAFKWYKPSTSDDTRVLHFSDDYFIDIIQNNKLPTIFQQTQLRGKLSYSLQQRIRNCPFNDISDGDVILFPVDNANTPGDCIWKPSTYGTNRAILDNRFEKEKAITILKLSSVTPGQRLRLETIFAHEYVYTNEDTNKNLNRN
jgi:hypothetical protein